MFKWLFEKILTRKLKKDKDLMKSLDEYDKSAQDLAKTIEDLERDGIEIPDELKKLAKMK